MYFTGSVITAISSLLSIEKKNWRIRFLILLWTLYSS